MARRRWATPEEIAARAQMLNTITQDAIATENSRNRAVTALVERLNEAEAALGLCHLKRQLHYEHSLTLERELEECRFTIRCLTDGDGRCPALRADVNRCVRPYGHKESHLTERGFDWKDKP